jgi:(E)-4-hydroxy-3-methylbut-2-enyl-diphosphate synthase
MFDIIREIEPFLNTLNKKIKVAVMGCVVNGPGEARNADIGIAGGKDCAVLFKKGQIIRKIDENNIVNCLIEYIKNEYGY